MGTVRIQYHVVYELDGNVIEFGDPHKRLTGTAFTEMINKKITIPVSTAVTLLDVITNDVVLAGFTHYLIACDFDVMVEEEIDSGGDVSVSFNSFKLKGSQVANAMGVPRILESSTAYANQSVGFGGTLDNIEKVKVKNLSSTQASQVQIVACR
jgi:hypothetical protein|tara:strand:- start:431 stop:892 length:462 start_codon:yes stop_codon:yes gene_type:complete